MQKYIQRIEYEKKELYLGYNQIIYDITLKDILCLPCSYFDPVWVLLDTKTKSKYSGKLIPKNNLRIEFEDFCILPEHIKEQYAEWNHGVKPIFNDEGECVEVGEHSKKDKELLFKILLAALELGRPSTKIEIEKAANLSSPISDSHMIMLQTNNSLDRIETSEKLPFFFSFIEEWEMYINRTWCFASQILSANKGNLPEEKFAELKKML